MTSVTQKLNFLFFFGSTSNFYNGLHGVSLLVNQSQQCDHSCPCFSCCYTYEPFGGKCPLGAQDKGGNEQCSATDGHCCTKNDMVIECSKLTSRAWTTIHTHADNTIQHVYN